MGEAQAVDRIEANLPQGKIDFINSAYAEEVHFWKRAALGSKNEEERKQLTDVVPLKNFSLVKMLERVALKIFMKCFFS